MSYVGLTRVGVQSIISSEGGVTSPTEEDLSSQVPDGADIYTTANTFTVASLDVYVNGIYIPPASYTVQGGNASFLLAGLVTGDKLHVAYTIAV